MHRSLAPTAPAAGPVAAAASVRRRATAAAPAAAASSPAPATAASSALRRAADVAVIGGSLQAYAAAYLLARRGKRTVLIEHASPQLVPAGGGSHVPGDVILHLPATTPHLVNEGTEALALWRGVEAAADARGLLQLCGSIDIALARGSSAASDALDAMQDACKAAGLPFGMLSAEEVSTTFPRLRPPRGSASLYTNLGGVVQGRLAAAVLAAMAQRAGADVARAGRARCLLGWRDAGGHFALRCGPAAAAAAGAAAGDEEVIWECERLLLLPQAEAQQQALAVFGLAVPGAALWRVPAGRWQAQEECGALPVWQLMGTGSTRLVDDPTAIDSCWGTPVLDWSRGGMLVAQSLADGGPAAGTGAAGAAGGGEQQQQEQQQQQEAGRGRGDTGGQLGAMEMLDEAVAAAAGMDLLGLEERPGSEEAIDRELKRLAEEQQQREAAQRRLATAGSLAGRLVYGMGAHLLANNAPDGRRNDSRQQQQKQQKQQRQQQRQHLLLTTTPDGEPAVGSHPGFEPGRVVVAFPAAGATPGCLPGDQLAPLVARMAVSELLGQPLEAVDAGTVALGREDLGAEALPLPADSWEQLGSFF